MPRRFSASFIIACLIPAFVIGILIMTSSFQDSLLLLGGRIVGKDMISSRWKDFFTEYGGKLVLVSVLLLLYLIRSSLDSDRLVKFDRAFLLVVFASWLVLAVVSVFLHEPWRDEVHVWNIARSMNLAQIFHEMRYEGHFVAWFYLMVPFARLGFPPMTLNIISMLIMGMCAAILLFRSPFSIYAKTAFVFTLPMLYYYSVVSRCYCLFALCCFALADLFKKRREHPYLYAAVLALLANSHAYAEGMVAVLTLDAFIMDIVLPWKSLGQKDRRDRITALFIVCFFVLFAFMQVAPAFSSSPAINSKRRFGTDAFFSACIGFFLALDLSTLSQFLLMIVAFFSVHYLARIRKTELLLILELSVLWMILFAAILYGASIPNRAWMFFFVLLFAFWQLDDRMASVLLLLLSLAAFNPAVSIRDWKGEFSTAKSTAAFIRQNIEKGERIYLPYTHANYSMIFFAPDYDYRSFETGESVRAFSWGNSDWEDIASDLNVCVGNRLEENGGKAIFVVGLKCSRYSVRDLSYEYEQLLEPHPSIMSESFDLMRIYDMPIR